MTKPDTDGSDHASSDDSTAGDYLANEETAALIERLTGERDEAIESRKRALADFVNFQRRAGENELRARDAGATSVVKALLPVLDQMDLALGAAVDAKSALTVDRLLEAIGMLRAETNRSLDKVGVQRIAPAAGDEFDPHVHEAVMRQVQPGVDPNRVATCFQAGYRLGDITLRPAKVSVTPE